MKESLGHFKINGASSLFIFLRCQDTYPYLCLPAADILPTWNFASKCSSGNTVGRAAASQLQGSSSNLSSSYCFCAVMHILPMSVWVCLGFSRTLSPPKNMSAFGLNCEWVCECVHGALWPTVARIPQVHRNLDQNEVVTEDERMNEMWQFM